MPKQLHISIAVCVVKRSQVFKRQVDYSIMHWEAFLGLDGMLRIEGNEAF